MTKKKAPTQFQLFFTIPFLLLNTGLVNILTLCLSDNDKDEYKDKDKYNDKDKDK